MRDLLTADHSTFYRDYDVVVAAGAGAGVGSAQSRQSTRPSARSPGPQDHHPVLRQRLATGVTVPAWTGIFMLRELQESLESYFRAAFRVQSPGRRRCRTPSVEAPPRSCSKEHCCVLDFAEQGSHAESSIATRLGADAASQQDKEAAVDEFMEFLPVLSFDGYG